MTDPYAKLPDESDQWNARLIKYLQAGPNRSLRAIYAAETGNKGSIPGAWQKAVKRFKWMERAAAFDAQAAAHEIDDFEAHREKVRAARRGMLDSLLVLAYKAQQIEDRREQPDLKALKTLTEVIKMVLDQLRIEYQDDFLKPDLVINNNVTAQADANTHIDRLDATEDQKQAILAMYLRRQGMIKGEQSPALPDPQPQTKQVTIKAAPAETTAQDLTPSLAPISTENSPSDTDWFAQLGDLRSRYD